MDDDFSGLHAAVRKIEAGKRGPKPGKETPESAAHRADDNTRALRSLVDQIVHLEEQRRGIQSDIKTKYEAVKNADFTVKAVKIIVKREMEDADQKAAREAVENEVDTLTVALGNFAFTPLGEAALAGAGTH